MTHAHKKHIAMLLVIAFVLSILPVNPIKAKTSDIVAWVSAESEGSSIQFTELGSTVYLNYIYTGNLSSYRVCLKATSKNSTVLYEVIGNTKTGSLPFTVNDLGDYDVSVTVSGNDEEIINNFTITAAENVPHILSQPDPVTTDENKTVAFSVETDAEDAEYQWYQASTVYDVGKEIFGAISNTLTLLSNDVTAALNGNYYYCLISTKDFSINSQYALLTVTPNPSVSVPDVTVSPTTTPTITATPTETPTMTVTPTTVPTETTTETPVVTNTPAVSTSPDVTEPAEKEPEVTEIPTIIPTETPTATSTPVPATAITPVPTQTASTVPDQSKRKVQLSGSYKVSKKGIYLTWTKVSGAAYYTVWRFSPNAKTAVKLTSLTGTHFVDKSAEIGKTYRYSITMVTTNRSLYASNLKSIKADPKPVLKKITVKKKKRIVKIKWKYSEVKKVLIYANTGNGYQKIGTVSGKKSLCTIKIPAGYSKVSFRIRGYNTVKKKKYYSKYSKPQKIKL